MAHMSAEVVVYDFENPRNCQLISFPEGGKIIASPVVDGKGCFVVLAELTAPAVQKHIHIVKVGKPFMADNFTLIGMWFHNGETYLVLEIPTEAEYGEYSQEYVESFGYGYQARMAYDLWEKIVMEAYDEAKRNHNPSKIQNRLAPGKVRTPVDDFLDAFEHDPNKEY